MIKSEDTRFQGICFPDDSCRTDMTRTTAEFLKAPGNAAAELLDQITYGFYLSRVPR